MQSSEKLIALHFLQSMGVQTVALYSTASENGVKFLNCLCVWRTPTIEFLSPIYKKAQLVPMPASTQKPVIARLKSRRDKGVKWTWPEWLRSSASRIAGILQPKPQQPWNTREARLLPMSCKTETNSCQAQLEVEKDFSNVLITQSYWYFTFAATPFN